MHGCIEPLRPCMAVSSRTCWCLRVEWQRGLGEQSPRQSISRSHLHLRLLLQTPAARAHDARVANAIIAHAIDLQALHNHEQWRIHTGSAAEARPSPPLPSSPVSTPSSTLATYSMYINVHTAP